MKTKLDPLYIFDLDGTLANIDHRLHHIQDGNSNWSKFYGECWLDLPNKPIIATMDLLRYGGAEVWIFTGRSAKVRYMTVNWLVKHTSFVPAELDTALVMRVPGDYTQDHQLKKSWYDNMLTIDRKRLVGVYEDRLRVVEMWRELGVTCFSVASDGGNF